MSCVYWEPKSRISTRSVAVAARGRPGPGPRDVFRRAAVPRPDCLPGFRPRDARTRSPARRASDATGRAQCRNTLRPVKLIARPWRSHASITSASRIEPPGWTIAEMLAAAACSMLSANGKNASLASTAPRRSWPGAPRLHERQVDGVDAARLPGAEPDELGAAREHDRVRARHRDHLPREPQRLDLGRGRPASRDRLPRRCLLGDVALREPPWADGAQTPAVPGRHVRAAQAHDAQVLLGRERRLHPGRELRGRHALDELTRQRLRRLGVQRAVERDDPAVRRQRIRRERLRVRLRQRRGARHAARLVVLRRSRTPGSRTARRARRPPRGRGGCCTRAPCLHATPRARRRGRRRRTAPPLGAGSRRSAARARARARRRSAGGASSPARRASSAAIAAS